MVWECPDCTAKDDTINCSLTDQTEIEYPKLQGINVGQLNVRDIMSLNKTDDLHTVLMKGNFDAFGVSESWLHDSIHTEEICLPGYNIFRQERKNISCHKRRGGGVLLYIKKEYDVDRHEVKSTYNIDIVHVSISKPTLKSMNIIMVYKPPETPIQNLIDEIKPHMKICKDVESYWIGDFNINMIEKIQQSITFTEFMTDNGYRQLIAEPTRTTHTSATLIDCIFANRPHLVMSSGVLQTSIADHDLTYCSRKKAKNSKCAIETREIRVFKNNNFELLREYIKTAPLWIFEHSKNVSGKFDVFQAVLKHVLDIHAPKKTCQVKIQQKRWMNATYECLTRRVNKARKVYMQDKTEENWKAYKLV